MTPADRLPGPGAPVAALALRARAAALILLAAAGTGRAAAAEPPDFELPPATAAPHLEFSAEHFDYDRSTAVIHLKGRIQVRESTWTIRADELWLDAENRRMRAAGNLQMADGRNLLFGDEGEYDLAAGTGTLRWATAGFAPWRIQGEVLHIDARRRYRFERARFTSCNLDDIHYQFKASRVYVRPSKWLIAANAVLFIGKVPVFYSPVVWKSLRPKHVLRTRFQPGYDRRNGAFVRTTTLYTLTPELDGRFFLDYYGAQGPGVGNQLEYRRPGAADGALYGYRIHDRHQDSERWAVLGSHYQAVASSVSFQMRLQTQSDPDFNNHYSRSSTFRVAPELVNGTALVRATPRGTLRLSYSRLDTADPVRRVFLKTQESVPRLDFQSAPVALGKLPLLNTFTASADNSYDRNRGFLRKAAGAGWEGTRTFGLRRGVSLTPRLGLDETYENRRDDFDGIVSTRTFLDAWTGRYTLGGTLRFGTPFGDWDLSHVFRQRLEPDDFRPDRGAADKGVEANLLTLGEVLRPSRSLFLRLETGYDWRSFRNASPGFRARVQPFTADAIWAPREGVSVSLRDDYQLEEGNRSFILQADLGDRERRYLGLGFGQNLTAAGHYLLSQEFVWGPSTGTWKVGGILRTDLNSAGGMRFDDAQVFEKELWVSKDFHDFFGRILVRVRPGGVTEVAVRVVLRLEPGRPVTPPPTPRSGGWKPEE